MNRAKRQRGDPHEASIFTKIASTAMSYGEMRVLISALYGDFVLETVTTIAGAKRVLFAAKWNARIAEDIAATAQARLEQLTAEAEARRPPDTRPFMDINKRDKLRALAEHPGTSAAEAEAARAALKRTRVDPQSRRPRPRNIFSDIFDEIFHG